LERKIIQKEIALGGYCNVLIFILALLLNLLEVKINWERSDFLFVRFKPF
jgi:hypothetical protein